MGSQATPTEPGKREQSIIRYTAQRVGPAQGSSILVVMGTKGKSQGSRVLVHEEKGVVRVTPAGNPMFVTHDIVTSVDTIKFQQDFQITWMRDSTFRLPSFLSHWSPQTVGGTMMELTILFNK